jgi:high-affinity nickel permease
MDGSFPLVFAAVVGFGHAFEADHLLAVSNIVTKRNSVLKAAKDGIAWGLGHTSMILGIGGLLILGKVSVTAVVFHYFEAGVGLMLMGLGIYRIAKIVLGKTLHTHTHADHTHDGNHSHGLAYGVGLIHGLAGSGALVLLVMSQIPQQWNALAYLLIFGMGSIVGMFLASGVFSLPFSRNFSRYKFLQTSLALISSVMCVGFGLRVIIENLF